MLQIPVIKYISSACSVVFGTFICAIIVSRPTTQEASFHFHWQIISNQFLIVKIKTVDEDSSLYLWQPDWTSMVIARDLQTCMTSPGYMYDNEAYFCYKVHTVRVKWEEAQDVCHSEGGELAKVETAAKRSIVNPVVAEDGSREYFLGGRDSEKDGEWRWVSDNSLVEGFNKKGSTECLEIAEDLTFDDTGCSNQDRRYICELLLP